MLENKVKLQLQVPEIVTIEYGDAKIEVLPYMDLAQQVVLINAYINDYFGKIEGEPFVPYSEYHYIEAETKLIYYLFQTHTNIDVLDKDFDQNILADERLTRTITSMIVNYDDFKFKLNTIIKEMKEQMVMATGAGAVLKGIADKISQILDSIPEMNPEDIERLQKEGSEMLERLEKSSVLSNKKDIEEESPE